MPRPAPLAALVLATAVALASRALPADVLLDGVVVPKATTTMSIPVDITEFRELGGCPQLLVGCPKPTVCITAPQPLPTLDGQLAGAPAARFAVGVEDGRTFGRCVPSSLNADLAGNKRRYVYCLRCESVSAP